MAKLAIFLGTLPVLAVEIGDKPTRLGRASDNDILLPLPDVADLHAEILATDEICEIRALAGESILFRGRPVSKARLKPGEEVDLGGYSLRWLAGEGRESPESRELEMAALRSHGTRPLEPAGEKSGGVTAVEVAEGADKGMDFPLSATVTTVGRSPDCDIVLGDDSVSWRHCTLELTREGIRVRDLGSRNGTLLDGRRTESALAGARARIRVGQTTLLLTGGKEVEHEASKGLAELVGESSAMQEVYGRIREAASTRAPVLISGETGTGKELVARAVHSLGSRSSGPFLPINCAAIPRQLLEAELFGYVKGAFTGAEMDRKGAFERADGGTLFLDEIGDLPLDLQPKILRVLEDGRVPRLGGGEVPSNFRIVAATNTHLADAIGEQRFRQDLYYRVAVLEIPLPPLRDHRGDLEMLCQHFLSQSIEMGELELTSELAFDEAALRCLTEHTWPGNVRELKNLVVRAGVAAATRTGQIDSDLIEELLAESPAVIPNGGQAPQTLEEFEVEVIRRTLQDCHGQKRAAARRLGIAESTLYDKIRRYGLR
jgi:DNA-binding NtrC family response regulator